MKELLQKLETEGPALSQRVLSDMYRDPFWLERFGSPTGCIRLEERRWCYEHVPPEGNRAEMLRIRNEPVRGVSIGAMYYYIVDFDLEGLVDVGSTTKIEAHTLARHRHLTPRSSQLFMIPPALRRYHLTARVGPDAAPATRAASRPASWRPRACGGLG